MQEREKPGHYALVQPFALIAGNTELIWQIYVMIVLESAGEDKSLRYQKPNT